VNRDIRLRPLAAADLDGVAGLVGAVRWPHRPADIAMLMQLGHGLLAQDRADGSTLGAGLWWPFGERLARVGLVIIAPDSQGRGIGRRLMEALLDAAAPRSVALLATAAGQPLYEKLGFRVVGGNCQHQGEYRGDPGGAAGRDPRIRAAAADDMAALLALDAAAFGERREPALRHLAEAGRTFVLAEDGGVTGYAMERGFGRGSVVGPIVAASEDDAIALFRAAARPGFARVDRTVDAGQFGRYLDGCGLTLCDESPAMLRGDPLPLGAAGRIYAMSSHALG